MSSAPLRLLVKGPQLQDELQLGVLLLTLLHRGQPVSWAVEGHLNNLELAQSCLVDVLLLHDVQLWGGEDWEGRWEKRPQTLQKKKERKVAEPAQPLFKDVDCTSVVSAAEQPLHKHVRGRGSCVVAELRLFL